MPPCTRNPTCTAIVETYAHGYVLGGLCRYCLARVLSRQEAAESPKKWWKRKPKKRKRG